MASNRQVKKYAVLFRDLINSGEISESQASTILIQTIDVFGREDRIVWALNRIKYYLTKTVQTLTTAQRKFLAKGKNKAFDKGYEPITFHSTFEHFLCQQGAFDGLTFTSDLTVLEAITKLTQIENRQLAKIQNNDRLLDEYGKRILEVNDSLVWFDLERQGCAREGRALSHCGNGHGRPNETILSLREKVSTPEGDKWMPHATFIFNKSTHKVGEAKGRFNQKPSVIHHEAIVSLLVNYGAIDELVGGGYLAQNNFSTDDLSEADKIKLAQHRPELLHTVSPNNHDLYTICRNGAERFTQTPWAKLLFDRQSNNQLPIEPSTLRAGKFTELVKSRDDLVGLLCDESWIAPYVAQFSDLEELQKSVLTKTLEAITFCELDHASDSLYSFLKTIENEPRATRTELPESTFQILSNCNPDTLHQLLEAA